MNHLERLFNRYPTLKTIQTDINNAYVCMEQTFENGGKLLACGNGGSASDADHIIGELMKGFYKQRNLNAKEMRKYGHLGQYLQGALPAISLTHHTALSTAFLNDVEPSMVFAQQVYGYGVKDDVLIAISTSGNSNNVINAAKIAHAKEMKVIALTGKDGGVLKEISNVCVIAPSSITADIQEFHLPIYHTWCAMLEEHFFPQ